jgi:hypothetical protein
MNGELKQNSGNARTSSGIILQTRQAIVSRIVMAETIDQEHWSPVPFDEVVTEFLRAEAFKLKEIDAGQQRLIDSPNLSNRGHNLERRRMLYTIRGGIFQRVPPDTQWHLVRSIRNRHLNQLLAIGGNCGWDPPDRTDRNELMRVAKRSNGRRMTKARIPSPGTSAST